MAKWTYQSLIDAGMTISVYCHNSRCHHKATLDLMALRDRFGPDARAMHDDIAPKLRCAKCGGREVGLTYLAEAKERGENAYAKARGR